MWHGVRAATLCLRLSPLFELPRHPSLARKFCGTGDANTYIDSRLMVARPPNKAYSREHLREGQFAPSSCWYMRRPPTGLHSVKFPPKSHVATPFARNLVYPQAVGRVLYLNVLRVASDISGLLWSSSAIINSASSAKCDLDAMHHPAPPETSSGPLTTCYLTSVLGLIYCLGSSRSKKQLLEMGRTLTRGLPSLLLWHQQPKTRSRLHGTVKSDSLGVRTKYIQTCLIHA